MSMTKNQKESARRGCCDYHFKKISIFLCEAKISESLLGSR
jgi:hypothetical protein